MNLLAQQNSQLALLSAEIRKLERKKDLLIEELERLSIQTRTAYTEAEKQGKDLKKRHLQLQDRIETLRPEVAELEKTYEETKFANQEYPRRVRREADERLKAAQELAQHVEEEVVARKRLAEEAQEEAYQHEARVKKKEELLLAEKQKLLDDRALFMDEKETWEKGFDNRLYTINVHTDTITALQKTIERLSEHKKEIEKANTQLLTFMKQTEDEYTKRVMSLELRESATRNRSTMLDKQKNDQDIRETLILDRQGQLDRAIKEWHQKGVSI